MDYAFHIRCIVSILLVIPAIGYIAREILISNATALGCFFQFLMIVLSLVVLGYFESGQVISVQSKELCGRCIDTLSISHKSVLWAVELMNNPESIGRYLMGRQLCVIITVFYISALVTFPNNSPVFSDYLQWILISSGLPGALLTMIFGQMYPQLMGEEYSIRFLCRPGSALFIKIALLVEYFGVFTSFSHTTTLILTCVLGFKFETGRGLVYRGSHSAERVPKDNDNDDSDDKAIEVGSVFHIVPLELDHEDGLAREESLIECPQGTFTSSHFVPAEDLQGSEYMEYAEEDELNSAPSHYDLQRDKKWSYSDEDGYGQRVWKCNCTEKDISGRYPAVQACVKCSYCHESCVTPSTTCDHLKTQSTKICGSLQLPFYGSSPPSQSSAALFSTHAWEVIRRASSGVLTAIAGYVVGFGLWSKCTIVHTDITIDKSLYAEYAPITNTLVLLVCMLIVFYLEGLQIAVLCVSDMDPKEISPRFCRTKHIHAAIHASSSACVELDCTGTSVLKRFLIGRQLLVVLAMFAIASVLTPPSISCMMAAFGNIHQFPNAVVYICSAILKSGIAGMLFLLNTVQLPSQLLAKKYPLQFLNIRGCGSVLNACLCVEKIGVCHTGWMLYFYSRIMCYGKNNYEPATSMTWEEGIP